MNKNHYISASASTLALLAASSTAAVAEGFDGAYVGLSVNSNGGYIGDGSTSPDYDAAGLSASAFAGYNFALGQSMIAGVELSHSVSPVSSPDYRMDTMIDLKARLGYSFGKTMIYGFAGASNATMTNGGDSNYNSTGSNFGVGVEHMVSDRLGLGLEMMRRDLSVSSDYGDAKVDSIAFRATLRF